MTLNGHFALKSGSCSASKSNGLAFWLSEKTVRKFAELRIYCRKQVKYKNNYAGTWKKAKYDGDENLTG